MPAGPRLENAQPDHDDLVSESGRGEGWADVWKKGHFDWEYKGKGKDLGVAYDQLLKYREALENPPVPVVYDMDRIVIHTNFSGTRTEIHDLPLAELGKPRNLEILRAVFHDPNEHGIGTVRYPGLIPCDEEHEEKLARRAALRRNRSPVAFVVEVATRFGALDPYAPTADQ